jgi:hypothetical protein
MMSIEARELVGDVAGSAGTQVGPRTRRREEFELLGLLLGILLVLLVLALTIGVGSAYLT